MKNPILDSKPEIRYFDYVPDPIILQHILPEISDPQDFKDLISVDKRFRNLVLIYLMENKLRFPKRVKYFENMKIQDVERELIRSGFRNRTPYIFWRIGLDILKEFRGTKSGECLGSVCDPKFLSLDSMANYRYSGHALSFIIQNKILHVMLRLHHCRQEILGMVCMHIRYDEYMGKYTHNYMSMMVKNQKESLIAGAIDIINHHEKCIQCFRERS